jgi:hypothetical protein
LGHGRNTARVDEPTEQKECHGLSGKGHCRGWGAPSRATPEVVGYPIGGCRP